MEKLITVTIEDSKGNTFCRKWKSSANKIDAIRWTIESRDVPYYIDIDDIIKVNIS